MRITIEPTPVKDMKPDDFFRDGGQSVRIAGFEQDDGVVEVTHFIEDSDLVNSFFLASDDTLDKIIETQV